MEQQKKICDVYETTEYGLKEFLVDVLETENVESFAGEQNAGEKILSHIKELV